MGCGLEEALGLQDRDPGGLGLQGGEVWEGALPSPWSSQVRKTVGILSKVLAEWCYSPRKAFFFFSFCLDFSFEFVCYMYH